MFESFWKSRVIELRVRVKEIANTVKLGNKELFDKEHLALRNYFRVTQKFLIAEFNCITKK